MSSYPAQPTFIYSQQSCVLLIKFFEACKDQARKVSIFWHSCLQLLSIAGWAVWTPTTPTFVPQFSAAPSGAGWGKSSSGERSAVCALYRSQWCVQTSMVCTDLNGVYRPRCHLNVSLKPEHQQEPDRQPSAGLGAGQTHSAQHLLWSREGGKLGGLVWRCPWWFCGEYKLLCEG